MNKTLDSFESALLLELRQHVAEHPTPEPVRVRRPRRRLRLAALGATGVAASVIAVFGFGGTGGSPAYAVAENSDGDVIVTVHRLDDAAGLESALKAKGIDADVSYDSDSTAGNFIVDGPGQTAPPPPVEGPVEGGTTQESGGGVAVEAVPGGNGDGMGACGGDVGPFNSPATLTQEGSDWVLRIPADSPLQDRHVEIGTSADGALSVEYAGSEPGSYCGVMSMGAPPPPKSPSGR